MTIDEQSGSAAVCRHHPTANLGAFHQASPAAGTDAPCFIELTGDTPHVLTYAEMHHRVGSFAAAFRNLGLEDGKRAALCLSNSADFVLAFLALMRIGAIPILVNPQLSADPLRHVLSQAGVDAILADAANAPNLRHAGDAVPRAIRLSSSPCEGWVALEDLVAGVQPDHSVCKRRFDDQAFQPYTAGSTGIPKGILLTHGGMLWGIEHSQLYWPMLASERGIVAAPMFHKNALRGTIKPVLRAGGSIVIMKRFEAREYLRALADYRVTTCGGVPAMFAELLRHEDLIRSLDFSSLRSISVGSSVVSEQLLDRLARSFPHATPKESYGLTEGGGPLRSPIDGRHVPRGSVGCVAPETEVRLVDAEGRDDAERGELLIRSPYILKEYVGLPDLTRQRLGDGWLRTGDLFRVDPNGFYFFLGRTDDMFVCGGENIYPKEVEDILSSHAGILDAMVLAFPHETKGSAPVAIVVPREGQALSAEEIQAFCAGRGPSYAVPRAVIVCDAIPVTTAKKPDRTEALRLATAQIGPMLMASRRRPAGSP